MFSISDACREHSPIASFSCKPMWIWLLTRNPLTIIGHGSVRIINGRPAGRVSSYGLMGCFNDCWWFVSVLMDLTCCVKFATKAKKVRCFQPPSDGSSNFRWKWTQLFRIALSYRFRRSQREEKVQAEILCPSSTTDKELAIPFDAQKLAGQQTRFPSLSHAWGSAFREASSTGISLGQISIQCCIKRSRSPKAVWRSRSTCRIRRLRLMATPAACRLRLAE